MGDSLHTIELGESGSRVVFCHGLFGQGRNFTAIGKALSDQHRVTLVDMPDHGQSPWSDRFDYLAAADQVAELLGAGSGARTTPLRWSATRWAARSRCWSRCATPTSSSGSSSWTSRRCPTTTPPSSSGYIRAMRAIDLDTLGSRSEADAALVEAVPDPTVRGFLLQSLRREGDGWRWYLNLELLGRDLDAITDWPEAALAGTAPYDGPVLWVGGADSRVRPPPTTSRPWTTGSPATGGSRSRAPATGCTASSPRCSPRCCAGSSPD